VIFILSIIWVILKNIDFKNSQVKNNAYSAVEARVLNISNLGKPVGAKTGTASSEYKVELLYENETYEITTTDINFVSQCEDNKKMNMPVTVYYCDGKLYGSENNSTSKRISGGYLFSLGFAFVSLMAMAMSWGAYYDLDVAGRKRSRSGLLSDSEGAPSHGDYQ
jgi:hypothetical protein